VTPRGFAAPQLVAMILFEKFGQHQPLNRQSERYRREGIDLSLSTMAAGHNRDRSPFRTQ
jgi:transposase